MISTDRLVRRQTYDQYYSRIKTFLQKPETRAPELISLSLFTVVFFTFFAIIPTFKTIATLRKEITDSKNVEAKLTQKIHSLEQAENLYGQVAPQLEKINTVLPAEPEFERLAWQLNWLAQKNQLAIINGNFGNFPLRGITTKSGEVATLTVDLSLQGSFSNVKNFIGDLNRLDRLVKVDQVVLTSKHVKELPSGISVSLELIAYYLPL
jgi:Tfp pilus assembly protein PilO